MTGKIVLLFPARAIRVELDPTPEARFIAALRRCAGKAADAAGSAVKSTLTIREEISPREGEEPLFVASLRLEFIGAPSIAHALTAAARAAEEIRAFLAIEGVEIPAFANPWR